MTRPSIPRLSLREWQKEALQAWEVAGRRGVVEVATGGGKTRFALACVLAMADRAAPIQIIVPTIALADQWFVAIGEDLQVDSANIATLSSRSNFADIRRFNICVIDSARRLDQNIWGDVGRFLIVDECHRSGSPTNSLALGGATKATLGLSATPERQYDEYFNEIIRPALGSIIYRYLLEQATADGILTSFRLINVRVDLSPDEEDTYQALSRRIASASHHSAAEGGQSEHVEHLLRMRARISNQALVRIPTAVSLLERHRGQRSLIFHESIDAAEEIVGLLVARGHSATRYHSQIGEDLRRENLRLFRRGVYDTLVTCRALDEGLNLPEASVAIVAAASASDRQRIQRLGRVLRTFEGKSLAHVYTIYATNVEEERLRKEAERLSNVAKIEWLRAGVTP